MSQERFGRRTVPPAAKLVGRVLGPRETHGLTPRSEIVRRVRARFGKGKVPSWARVTVYRGLRYLRAKGLILDDQDLQGVPKRTVGQDSAGGSTGGDSRDQDERSYALFQPGIPPVHEIQMFAANLSRFFHQVQRFQARFPHSSASWVSDYPELVRRQEWSSSLKRLNHWSEEQTALMTGVFGLAAELGRIARIVRDVATDHLGAVGTSSSVVMREWVRTMSRYWSERLQDSPPAVRQEVVRAFRRQATVAARNLALLSRITSRLPPSPSLVETPRGPRLILYGPSGATVVPLRVPHGTRGSLSAPRPRLPVTTRTGGRSSHGPGARTT